MIPISKKYIPVLIAFTAVFALAISPGVLAQEETQEETKDRKYHKHMMPKIEGSLSASDSIRENLDSVGLSLLEAASIAEQATGGKVVKGSLAPIHGYLVYMFKAFTTETAHQIIVDAGDGTVLYISEAMSIEDLEKKMADKKAKHTEWGEGHMKAKYSKIHGDKSSHYKGMKDHFADLSPEEREAKMAQFKELKEAFEALSKEDSSTLMSHMKDIKSQAHDLSEEEKQSLKAKHEKIMEELMSLSLDEKIKKLQELANEIRNQS